MALFGRLPLGLVAKRESQFPKTQESYVPRRRGLFGGGLSGDRLMMLGAALQDAGQGGRTNNAAQMWAMQQDRDRGIRQDKLADEEAQQRTQRQQMIEGYIATLPPAQQVQARMQMLLDPEGFVASMRGGEWQHDGTTPYRIDPYTGALQVGSGTIPHRPRAPLIQYGAGLSEDGGIYTDELPPELR